MAPSDLPVTSRHEPGEDGASRQLQQDVDSQTSHISETQFSQFEDPSLPDNAEDQEQSLTPRSARIIRDLAISRKKDKNPGVDPLTASKHQLFARPVSSGEDKLVFQFTPAIKPNLDFSGTRKGPVSAVQQPQKPSPKAHVDSHPQPEAVLDRAKAPPEPLEPFIEQIGTEPPTSKPNAEAVEDAQDAAGNIEVPSSLPSPQGPKKAGQGDSAPPGSVRPKATTLQVPHMMIAYPAVPKPVAAKRPRRRPGNGNSVGQLQAPDAVPSPPTPTSTTSEVPEMPSQTNKTVVGPNAPSIPPERREAAARLQGPDVATKEGEAQGHRDTTGTERVVDAARHDLGANESGAKLSASSQNQKGIVSDRTRDQTSSLGSKNVRQPSSSSSRLQPSQAISLNHVAPVGSPRVTKSRVPAGQRAASISRTASTHRPEEASGHSLPSSPHNQTKEALLQMLQAAFLQDEQQLVRSYEAKQKSQEKEIMQLKHAKQLAFSELDLLKKQKSELSAKLEKYTKSKDSYAKNLANMKSFMDGVDGDLKKFREETREFQQKCSDLVLEAETQREERASLQELFNHGTTNFANVKNEVRRTCTEANKRLFELQQSRDHYHQELNNTMGLLAEERNKCSALEKRLDECMSDYGKLKRSIESQHQFVIDQLYLLQATAEQYDVTKRLQADVGQCLELVQALRAEEQVTPGQITHVEHLIQSFVQSASSQFDDTKFLLGQADSANRSTEKVIMEQLAALKDSIASERTLQHQIIELTAVKVTVEKECIAKEGKLSEVTVELKAAHEKEAALNLRVSGLETQLESLKRVSTPEGRETRHTRSLETQLANLRAEVQTLRDNLAKESDQLQSATSAADGLRSELEETSAKLTDAENKLLRKSTELAESEQRHTNVLHDQHTELSKDAIRVRRDQNAAHENELHQERQKTAGLETQLTATREEMQTAQNLLQIKEEEISDLQKKHAAETKKLQKQKPSPQEIQVANEAQQAMEKEVVTLKDQIQAKNAEIERLLSEFLAASGKVQELESVLEESKGKFDENIRQKQSSLSSAEARIAALKLEVEQERKNGQSALKEQQAKFYREKDQLHQQLAETRTTVQQKELDNQRLRKDAEEAQQKQKEKHTADLRDMQRLIDDAEAAKNQAEIEKQDLRHVAETVKDASEKEKRAILQRETDALRRVAGAEQRATDAESALRKINVMTGQRSDLFLQQATGQESERPPTRGRPMPHAVSVETPPDSTFNNAFKKPRRTVNRYSQSTTAVAAHSEDHWSHSGGTGTPGRGGGNHVDIAGQRGASRASQQHESIPETVFDKKQMSISPLSDSLGECFLSQVTQSPTGFSDAENILDGQRSSQIPARHTQPDESRVLREVPTNASSPVSHTSQHPDMRENDTTIFSNAGPVENEFLVYESPRMKSQANTASRMTRPTRRVTPIPFIREPSETTHATHSDHATTRTVDIASHRKDSNAQSFQPQNQGSRVASTMPVRLEDFSKRGSDTPDFIQREPFGSHKITTYHRASSRPRSGASQRSNTRPPSREVQRSPFVQNSQTTRKRRSSVTSPADNTRAKRPRDEQQIRAEPSDSRAQSRPPSQSLRQSTPFKASQSQRQPLGSLPVQGQSRMRMGQSSQKNAVRGGKKRSNSKNDRYNLRFSQELGDR